MAKADGPTSRAGSAKRPETREQRLLTTIEWTAEGKSRHWKYKNC